MEENIIQNKKEVDEISLVELIRKLRVWIGYLLSKWLMIFALGILGGVLGGVYAYFQKPVYTAACTFVLEDGEKGGGGLGQYAGLASMAGIDLGGGGGGIFQGDNLLELYKSRNMIQKALLTRMEINGHDQLLVDFYITTSKLRKAWAKNPEMRNVNFNLNPGQKYTRLQDSLLKNFALDIKNYNLTVSKPDKKLSIIEVDVKSQNEQFAKLFNDQIVKTVNEFYVQTKTKKSLQNVQILQQKTDSVRAVMNGDIYTAAAVSDATPNLNPTRQIKRVAPVQRSQFSAETNKMVLSELVKNLELSKISLRKETPLIQVIDEPSFPLQKDFLRKIKGIIIGGVLFGILTLVFLSIKLIFKNTTSGE